MLFTDPDSGHNGMPDITYNFSPFYQLSSLSGVFLYFFQANFYPQTSKPALSPVAAADVTPAEQQTMQPANRQM